MRSFFVIAAILMGACSAEPLPPLVATAVVVTRPVPGSGTSAAYLTLTNNSEQAIRITRVTSAEFESVQIHESTLEDGVARMRALPELRIPPRKSVTLQRGGKHLMLMRPDGSADIVSLQFFDGQSLVLSVDAMVETKAH
ncbi:MAG: copper chaperone PCu(A)C [Gammaproteobacteria bacterium]|nr:copper chaperone PCu(A)C [Gammaproteobacteria bacterium]MDH3482455.1 copper chaperone PCu(A)C [Gammaproteobacteria bacterium]